MMPKNGSDCPCGYSGAIVLAIKSDGRLKLDRIGGLEHD